MTLHKEWFQNYRSCNGEVVYMGDNKECQLVGVGDIRIKMFDGCVSKIFGEKYVSTLWRSLLSMVKFNKHGLKFTSGNG